MRVKPKIVVRITSTSWDRPAKLAAAVVLTVSTLLLFNALSPFELFPDLLWPRKAPDWKEQFQAAILLIGLPVAFLVWHWRDRNVRDQIENARRDLNLKEFQDIQLRAAGAVDEKYPEGARTTLQISALHQLRPFFRGEHGDSFEKPAYETIRAVLQVTATGVGLTRLQERYDRLRWKFIARIERYSDSHKVMMSAQNVRRFIGQARQRRSHGNLTDLEFALQQVINEEWDVLTAKVYKFSPLNMSGYRLRNVKLASLSERTVRFLFTRFIDCNFDGANLSGSRMDGSYFARCSATGAVLSGCILDAVQIHEAKFPEADLSGCCIIGGFMNGDFRKTKFVSAVLIGSSISGDFDGADFTEANLRSARFHNASIRGAHFGKADLRGAHLPPVLPEQLASCDGAVFDQFTWFTLPTDGNSVSRTADEIATIHDMWRRHGARHALDPEKAAE